MSNRPPYNYDDNADDTYPPRDSYPPQDPLNIDDPRFGGGAPTPPRDSYPPQGGNYPPQGGNYPPQNQPPLPPNDPRFPAGGQARATGSYPPAGGQSYPPQGGQIDLNDPRYGGQGAVPPAPNPTGGYPQQPPAYPPQQPTYPPQGGQYPPSGGISLDDPNYGGRPPVPQQRPPAQRPSVPTVDEGYEYDRRIELGDVEVGRRGGGGGGRRRADDDDDNVVDRLNEGANMITERQVESVAWGSTVLLLGIALLLTVSGSTLFLTRLFPMLSGFILLASSIYQRFFRGWRVSPLTWLTAFALVSYTATLFVDFETSGTNINLIDWITYFIGTLIILTGITMLMRAFRR